MVRREHDLWASSTYLEVTFFFYLDEFPPKIHMETNGSLYQKRKVCRWKIPIFFVCFRAEVTWNAAFGQIPSQASALKQRYALLQHSAR